MTLPPGRETEIRQWCASHWPTGDMDSPIEMIRDLLAALDAARAEAKKNRDGWDVCTELLEGADTDYLELLEAACTDYRRARKEGDRLAEALALVERIVRMTIRAAAFDTGIGVHRDEYFRRANISYACKQAEDVAYEALAEWRKQRGE